MYSPAYNQLRNFDATPVSCPLRILGSLEQPHTCPCAWQRGSASNAVTYLDKRNCAARYMAWFICDS